jgi:hypothetical protein
MINRSLQMSRETMDDAIVENMLAGYTYLNKILKYKINPLDRYELNHLLELNHLVLCGDNLTQRKNFGGHIKETTERFYKQENFSIKHLREWWEKNRNLSSWVQAAGLNVMMLSRPQLFIEGNHRTGALLMSYILVANRQPPFVLTVDNAKAYFDPSTVAKNTTKDVLGKLYKLPKIRKNFAIFLKAQADYRLLVQD